MAEEGQLEHVTPPSKERSDADTLATVLKAAGLGGNDLVTFCRERAL